MPPSLSGSKKKKKKKTGQPELEGLGSSVRPESRIAAEEVTAGKSVTRAMPSPENSTPSRKLFTSQATPPMLHPSSSSRQTPASSSITTPKTYSQETAGSKSLPLIATPAVDRSNKPYGSTANSNIYLSIDDLRVYGLRSFDVVILRRVLLAQDDQAETSYGDDKSKTSVLLIAKVLPGRKVKPGTIVVGKLWAEQVASLNAVSIDHLSSAGQTCPAPAVASITLCDVTPRNVGGRPSDWDITNSRDKFQRADTAMLAALKDCWVFEKCLLSKTCYGISRQFKVTDIRLATQRGEERVASLQIGLITSSTQIEMLGDTNSTKKLQPSSSKTLANSNTSPNYTASRPDMSAYGRIGGLRKQLDIIRQMIELPLTSPEIFLQYGLKPPKGVLLYGPPGTGKTLIARTVAKELNATFFVVNGPEIVSKFVGESESKLRNIFEQAAEKRPSVVFIDEIDALCPKRDGSSGDMEKRVVATLLTLLDGVEESSQVVILAATNRPNALDPALRRPGRFDREIEIGIPNSQGREQIFRILMQNMKHCVSDSDIVSFATSTHGFVGADIAQVCKEAGLKAVQRALGECLSRVDLTVTVEDLKQAVSETKPSALREIAVDVPKVHWSDIGGQDFVKQQLREAVEWPLKHPEAFLRMGIRPPRGILMYGPPGCSKTLMAKALATETGMNFIAIKGPELFSKWVGESEKAVQATFKKARAAAPTIVFFDEIDALAVQRGADGDGGGRAADRVLSQLLTELDGIEPLKRVMVVAATNRPDMIDKALLRPGRIDRLVYVSPPDLDARLDILRIHTRKIPLGDDTIDLTQLATKTAGYSGAELASLCREASMSALEEDFGNTVVCLRHFEKALRLVRPQITSEMLEFFAQFA